MVKKAEAYWPLILLLALIKFVFPIFLQSPVYELQRDEFLYYQQGQHLALGYLENPPLLSYLANISSWFGGSEAWIKLWPCLFGAATLVITCLTCAALGGQRFAQFITGLGIITGAYMRIHFLFQPNILDIFFWTLSIYFLVRYINTKDENFIYGLALSLALGWWSKYSVLFMIIALFAGIILSPYRAILVKKKTWLAVALAVLIILPNLLWQSSHNWPLIHHMDELRETQLKYINRGDFLKEQFLLLLPVVFIWITGLIWLLRKPAYRILAIIYLIVIALLMFGSGKGYYALGAYPMLIAAGAVAIERWTLQKRWIRFTVTVLVILLSVPFIPMLLPIWNPQKLANFYKEKGIDKTGLLKWEDQNNHPLPQDFADMLGWKELAEKTEKYYATLPVTVQKETIIYGRHYGHAGSLQYYGKGNSFRNKVISDNGSFLLWIPDEIKFNHLIFVGRQMPDTDDEVFQHFEKYTIVDSVTNTFSRQYGDKIIYFENIDSTGMRLAIDGLKEAQRKFNH